MSFNESLNELKEVLEASRELEAVVTEAGAAIVHALRQGGKVLTCGNGGSAADALHLAEELLGRFRMDRCPLPAVCLNADVTALTCIANDYGYDGVFARQLQALGCSGDILVGFSTSGNSANVNAAFVRAMERGVTSILLGGKDGGQARDICDMAIVVPSQSTARIQEVHTTVLHQWLEQIEEEDWSSRLDSKDH